MERFKILITNNTKFFDCLVGYFFISGFYKLYPSLEKTEKIRILVGIKTDDTISKILNETGDNLPNFSHAEVKGKISQKVQEEMDMSENDDRKTEEGILKFIEWLKNKKLEVKAFPSENIHSKLYIMTFLEGDRDRGRVITGSSNFTQAGLVDNLEFNVELKNPSDYDFALHKFNELWENAVDVSSNYVTTIKEKTWLNDTVTPYQLYLKFLYEHFKEKINLDQESIFKDEMPENFLDLEYQNEAVKDAKSKLEQYGGVFISDVVGLGKTYISAMLAKQLDGRNLVIAPPMLLNKDNPGSWPNVFSDFKVHADFESIGKLDKLANKGTEKYKNIFVDEAHRFRTETTSTYEQLARICRGKRVILVTATPFNNSPKDILAQLKLFQKSRKSTIPSVPDLEVFFAKIMRNLKGLDRRKDFNEYAEVVKENSKIIRDKIFKHLMVRRTRSEIEKYFGEDLKRQGLKFPHVGDPESVFYELNEVEDEVFMKTIELIAKDFSYARYTPMLYYKGEISQPEKLAQRNMGKFMKILLIKRLESSFYAFNKSIDRFINSYQNFLNEFERGNVYVSKKYINKIFDFIDEDNDESIEKLIEEDKAKKYSSSDFNSEFKTNLEKDIDILRKIKDLWDENIRRDPKLDKFVEVLKSNKVLKDNKLIIFTESRETAEHLEKNLKDKVDPRVISYNGQSSASIREKVINNFDAKVKKHGHEYRILISTEALSEGVNLHQSNVVVNYDIPWNPTRMMQRVGRINRVDTKFPQIYTFNFFPTKQSNDQIKLREAAEHKIRAFIEMLGSDTKLLTDIEEIKSHDLFSRLTSKETITGEGEEHDSELKYLLIIRNIRDNNPDLFEKTKQLPKKARTARKFDAEANKLITYFRKGKLQKFFLSDMTGGKELDFFDAAKLLACEENTDRIKISEDFYKLLDMNKKAFANISTEEFFDTLRMRGGRDSATILMQLLRCEEVKKYKGFTEDEEIYMTKVEKLIEEGALPKKTIKKLIDRIKSEFEKGKINPHKILAILKLDIAKEFFQETMAESGAETSGPREIILSELLCAK